MEVGVVIPCYNQARLLAEALESVAWQTVLPHRVIVVDDCSPDSPDIRKVAALAQNTGLSVVKHPENYGLSASRNTGMELCVEAGCDALLPLDSDDLIEPEMIELGLQTLKEADMAYPDVSYFGKFRGSTTFPHRDPEELAQIILKRNEMVCCTLFRKEVWLKVREKNGTGYDPELHKEEYGGWEDWLFWMEAHLLGFRAKAIHRTLFRYRTKDDSMISRANKNGANIWGYFTEKIERLYGVKLGPRPMFS